MAASMFASGASSAKAKPLDLPVPGSRTILTLSMGIFMLAKSSVKPASTTLKDKFPIKSLPGIWPRNGFNLHVKKKKPRILQRRKPNSMRSKTSVDLLYCNVISESLNQECCRCLMAAAILLSMALNTRYFYTKGLAFALQAVWGCNWKCESKCQALKARGSTAQGGGCAAAETLG
jgi:hypothetical protein